VKKQLMVQSELNKMWGWFTGIGNLTSGLLRIFVIYKITTLTIKTIININALYDTFGWRIKLIAGIYSNLTHHIMHNTHNKKYESVFTNNIEMDKNPQNTHTNKYKSIYPNIRKLSV
jgi:hypothetical protein